MMLGALRQRFTQSSRRVVCSDVATAGREQRYYRSGSFLFATIFNLSSDQSRPLMGFING